MGVIEQVGLADDDPVGCPLIGYDNLVTASNVSASSSDADFPITNLANPATHLKWKSDVNVLVTLLHFDGSDGATVISDSAPTPRTWTAAGGGPAQLDTAQQKFGASSLLLATANSPDDYIIGDSNERFAFGAGNFTIEFFARFASVNSQQNCYDSRPAGTAGLYPLIYKVSNNSFRFHISGADVITGSTSPSINQWYHVAVCRSSGSTRMFIDGVQEGSTYADPNEYLIGSGGRPLIGSDGAVPGTNGVNGWIDEVRVSRNAIYTENFTPPSAPFTDATTQHVVAAVNSSAPISYVGIAKHNLGTLGLAIVVEINDGSGFVTLIPGITITNDHPIIVRLIPHTANSPAISSVRVSFVTTNAVTPIEIAVLYIGELLVLERSIDIGSGHVPITYGRRSNIVNGMSETGNFLGRVVLGEYRQSKAEFKWFTSDFYRSDIDAFLAAAQEVPFFWAWSPEEYPLEVGYVWLTNDAEPEVDPVTRRIALEIEMRGVV